MKQVKVSDLAVGDSFRLGVPTGPTCVKIDQECHVKSMSNHYITAGMYPNWDAFIDETEIID